MIDVKYINNDPNLGIEIDWDIVKKEFRKLKVPKEFPDLFYNVDFSKIGYYIGLSDRSRAKTTNLLLYGLILYKLYGIQLQYLRQTKNMVEPKMIRNLYSTVREHGYIAKIFDNEYTDIFYLGKRWYLCCYDENGEIIRKSSEHVTMCIGLDENEELKSVYNAPRGDIIFLDEFISSFYGYNDFVRFADICKTIIRDRISPQIFLMANTIDINSPWFDEMGIRQYVEAMVQGDSKYIETDYGTHIFLAILEKNISEQRFKVNRKFFGFKNPKLASITGKGGWAVESYPHIGKQKDGEYKILQDCVYIKFAEKFVKLKLVQDTNRGLCVWVHPATPPKRDDSIILTCEEITEPNQIFGVAKDTNLYKIYFGLYKQNKFFYSRNSEGAFVHSYLSYYQTMRREKYY